MNAAIRYTAAVSDMSTRNSLTEPPSSTRTVGVSGEPGSTADTTPTYQKTTTLTNALNSFVAGRHYVGGIVTPTAGGGNTTGGYTPPATGADTEADRDKYSSL